jgi:hypothetical protein
MFEGEFTIDLYYKKSHPCGGIAKVHYVPAYIVTKKQGQKYFKQYIKKHIKDIIRKYNCIRLYRRKIFGGANVPVMQVEVTEYDRVLYWQHYIKPEGLPREKP